MAEVPRSGASVSQLVDWHARYAQQAAWTAQTRQYLYQKTSLTSTSRVLEPGCGTGAILADCPAKDLHGVDWDFASLRTARHTSPQANLACANALTLPYRSNAFDACITHFFLLWVDAPRVMAEMRRVTRPGGWILALAEPDYGARIDRPVELAELGRLQGESLKNQGADPLSGRKLAEHFINAGMEHVTIGVMGGEWSQRPLDDGWEQEWAALEMDLTGVVAPEKLAELRRLDAAAWTHGERILFVPTFYALGRVP